jgi:hypothetical protein
MIYVLNRRDMIISFDDLSGWCHYDPAIIKGYTVMITSL